MQWALIDLQWGLMLMETKIIVIKVSGVISFLVLVSDSSLHCSIKLTVIFINSSILFVGCATKKKHVLQTIRPANSFTQIKPSICNLALFQRISNTTFNADIIFSFELG